MYKRFTATIIVANEKTKNGTYYTLECLQSFIDNAIRSGEDIHGWIDHGEGNALGRKVTVRSHSLRIVGNALVGEGLIKHDADTSPLIEDALNNFGPIRLSIVAKIFTAEERKDEDGNLYLAYTSGRLDRVDIVGVPSSPSAKVHTLSEFDTSKESAGGHILVSESMKGNINIMEESTKEQEVQSPVEESVSPLQGLFVEEKKEDLSAEIAELRELKAQRAFTAITEGVKSDAAKVYAPTAAKIFNDEFDNQLESARVILGLSATHQLTEQQVAECAKSAKSLVRRTVARGARGLTHQGLGSFDGGNTDLFSPDNPFANAVVEALKSDAVTRNRLNLDHVTWANVVADPDIARFLRGTVRASKDQIIGELATYNRVRRAAESLLNSQSGGWGIVSEGLTNEQMKQLYAIEGVYGSDDGSVDLTKWVPAKSCMPAVIFALCVHSSNLIKAIRTVNNDRYQWQTYEVCRPDTLANAVTNVYTVEKFTVYEIEAGPQMRVTYTNLSLETVELMPKNDYIISRKTDNTYKIAITNEDVFEGEATIDITVAHQPATDPCDVPVLLKTRTEERTLRTEWMKIEVPYCQKALQVQITKYGIDFVKDALAKAVFMIYEHFESILLEAVSHAAMDCLITAQEANQGENVGNIVPTWNETSIAWRDTVTDQSLSTLILKLEQIRNDCVSGSGSYVVMPSDLVSLLSTWGHVSTMNSNRNTIAFSNGRATAIAGMKIVEAGKTTTKTVDLGGGEFADVAIGGVYVLDEGALVGQVTQFRAQNSGKIYRSTEYTCEDGTTQTLMMPTGIELSGFEAKMAYDCVPLYVSPLQVVLEATKHCRNVTGMPKYGVAA